jgi:hypothetical protein
MMMVKSMILQESSFDIFAVSPDTPNRALTPQSEGLVAIATGFSLISTDDHDNMTKQSYVYDALFAYCKSDKKGASSRH